MRECGSCTLCCTVTRVPEFNKSENTMCDKCDNGCTIYNQRPESCKKFRCEWLNGDLNEDSRPDKIHAVVEKLPSVPIVLALLEPGRSITPLMTEVFAEYSDKKITVVASNGQALIADGCNTEEVRNYVMSAAKKMGVIK